MADIIGLCVGGQNSSSGTPEGESARWQWRPFRSCNPVNHRSIIPSSLSALNLLQTPTHTYSQAVHGSFINPFYWVNSLIQWSWFVHTLYFYYFFVNAANDACLHMVFMYKRNAKFFFSLENLWVRFMM